MRAIHLPPLLPSKSPPYSFPTQPPTPSALQYSPSFPIPTPPSFPKCHSYLISVAFTALTRGELTWRETLLPERFLPHGGAIPGHDVVGTIHAIYPAADTTTPPKFAVGDKVWGLIDFDRDGAASDFTIAFEEEIALLPPPPPDGDLNESEWEKQMSTLPLSALTGYQALFEHGAVNPALLSTPHRFATTTEAGTAPEATISTQSTNTPRPRILILGPTGSVGLPTLYLSLAASLPTVLVTTSRHVPFLESLTGSNDNVTIITTDAPHFNTLTAQFATQQIEAVDVVLDAVGAPLITDLLASPDMRSVLKQGAKVITIVAPLENLIEEAAKLETTLAKEDRPAQENGPAHSPIPANLQAFNVSVTFFIVKPSSPQLSIIGELATGRRMVGHVAASFPLQAGREAMEVVESKGSQKRRGRGKVVLGIGD